MNPDLSEFEALQSRAGPVCSIGLSLDALEGQERINLTGALANKAIQRVAIAKWLHAHGQARAVSLDALAAAVGRHRRDQCACRLRAAA